MQWWCAAQNVAWSWTWKAYPGVWLFMLLIAVVWVRRLRHAGARQDASGTPKRWAFVLGWLSMWIVLDWPVGALGAGYLASVHMVQFLVLALIAPPLLLLGWPHGSARGGGLARGRGSRFLTHPIVTLGVFTAVIIASHLPVTTDRLMPSQLGAFVIDTVWIGSGLLFWYPVLIPCHAWFSPPLRIVYLFALMVLMTAPGAMITFSDLPIYATYELAPPIPGVTPLEDQRIAGVGMRLGGSMTCWIAISILFLRWAREEEQLLRRELTPPG